MKATFAAITLAVSTAIAAPAMAGGTITFGYTAKNQDEANAMRFGMALYTLAKDRKQNGQITQGAANTAIGIVTSSGNHAIIDQQGNNQEAGMVMGNNGACMLVQRGNGATNYVDASSGMPCVVLGVGLN